MFLLRVLASLLSMRAVTCTCLTVVCACCYVYLPHCCLCVLLSPDTSSAFSGGHTVGRCDACVLCSPRRLTRSHVATANNFFESTVVHPVDEQTMTIAGPWDGPDVKCIKARRVSTCTALPLCLNCP